jgi:orotidine-5'-phosphate decarboxylase
MTSKNPLAGKIIIALDTRTKHEALSLVHKLPGADIFKVGLTLFASTGPALLEEIQNQGKKIFLDLKLHDIPNQIAGAVKAGVGLGVHMMTLHASGGREMMARAAEAAEQESRQKKTGKPLLLAVTVLTSLKGEQLKEIGMDERVYEQVLRLARLARGSGMDGVVCSPQEIDLIKKEFGNDFLVVSPGIRPEWAAAQDQKRILAPGEAIAKGVDYMVIGRPITEARIPEEAFLKIVEELDGAVNSSDSKNRS